MFKHLLTVLTLISVRRVFTEHECNHASPGKYCTDDLSGYHDCNYTQGGYVHAKICCPTGTRCSCFVYNKCPTNVACQPYAKPNLVQNFALGFKKTTTMNAANHGGYIIRNGKLGMFYKITSILNHQYFEVIRPNHHGKFEKYAGSWPTVCSKTELKTFPLFDDVLYKSTLMSTTHTSEKKTRQEWYFQHGRRHLGDTLTKTTWVLEKLDNTIGKEQYRPVSMSKKIEGFRSYFSTDFLVTVFHQNDYPKEFFPVPNHCLHHLAKKK